MNTFKRAKVVMLPTNKTEQITFLKHTQGKNVGKLQIPAAGGEYRRLLSYDFEPQHLYILSDDEIKEGDWVYIEASNSIRKVNFNDSENPNKFIVVNNNNAILKDSCKKIIVTTDKSLTIDILEGPPEFACEGIRTESLPQPSKSFIKIFIEEYNKGNIITDVMVEYEHGNWEHETNVHRKCVNCGISNHKLEPYNCNCDKKIKINPKDNTITIRKVKDSWTREEVEILIKNYDNYIINGKESLTIKEEELKRNNWIKNNL